MKPKHFTIPILILAGFSLFFCYDIYTLKKFLAQADISSNYFPYRHWFTSQLTEGNFPLWNPYWGLGYSADWNLSIPIDIFTPLEMIVGPQYHYFHAFQMFFFLLAVYYVFVRLNFRPLISMTAAILYFMMPWVTYFYFYFILTSSFIGNALLFLFSYLWFKEKEVKYLYCIFGVTLFSMFGTKAEFWFFNNMMFLFYSLVCARLFYAGNIKATFKQIILAGVFAGLGILAHSWQLNLQIQVMATGDRFADHTLLNLMSAAFYKNLGLSILESPFLVLLTGGVFIYFAATSKVKIKLFILFVSGAGIIYWFRALIVSSVSVSYTNPVLLGGLAGLLLALGFMRFQGWRPHVKAALLFVIFIYYFCRPIPGDLGEMSDMQKAPWAFMFVIASLIWMGCYEVSRNKLAQLAYLSIIFVFIMRDQGQLAMAYLIGLHWIPTRDNFIIDFCLIIIAILGLNNFCNSFVFDKGLWGRRLAGYGIPLITAGIVIFAPANLYYVHWMMVDAPPDYPYYKGIPQVRDAFKSIKESPFTRIMIVNKPTTSFPFGFGESMFEEVNQVTQYSSLTTKNYKDWALFRRTGIRPEQKLSIYNSAYTKKTIARLPKRNSLGMTPDVVYFYILIARPPLELDALRFLGINYVVVFNKSMADSGVGPFDLTGVDIPKRFEEMGLEDVREMPAGYYLYSAKIIKEGTIYEKETITIGRVPGPLPRAYRVSGVSEDRLEEFKQEMVVSISSEDTLKSAHYEFKYQAVDIDDYQAEKVQLDVQGEEDSYLVLADLNHPFWHAMLDGKEVKIIPAFHTMRGIKVPPGNHQVEFYLEVPHFSTTVVLSLLVIVLVSISFPFRTRYKFLHLER